MILMMKTSVLNNHISQLKKGILINTILTNKINKGNFHKLLLTILRPSFKKLQPKIAKKKRKKREKWEGIKLHFMTGELSEAIIYNE